MTSLSAEYCVLDQFCLVSINLHSECLKLYSVLVYLSGTVVVGGDGRLILVVHIPDFKYLFNSFTLKHFGAVVSLPKCYCCHSLCPTINKWCSSLIRNTFKIFENMMLCLFIKQSNVCTKIKINKGLTLQLYFFTLTLTQINSLTIKQNI